MSTVNTPLPTQMPTVPRLVSTGTPYLVRDTKSGIYYVRARGGGVVIRRTTGTSDLEEAKDRVPDLLLAIRHGRSPSPSPAPTPTSRTSWQAGTEAYMARTQSDPTLAVRSVEYRQQCLDAIAKTWPGLGPLRADQITKDQVLEWAGRLARKYSAQFYNNILSTGRAVFALLCELDGRPVENPFASAHRLGVKRTELTLPEPAQWREFLAWVDAHPSGGEASKFLRLLAYAGLRVSEATQVRWGDFDWVKGTLKVHSAKGRASSSASDIRRVPLIPELRAYFEPLAPQHAGDEMVAGINDARFWFASAHDNLDFPRISHHDLRHLFATRCIESGVDIPTVARWLGHKDGGVLAMRVYGHLRESHSNSAAQKVQFS